MKKTLLNLLLVVIGTLSLNATDFTFTYENQTLTYTITDEANKYVKTKDGSSEAGAGNNVSGDLIIPEKVTYKSTEYTVTELGSYAFKSSKDLMSITIPESVSTLGSYAFYGCSGLTSITIPESVKNIRDGAFWCCSRLTSITIPESVTTIQNLVFAECISLTSVIIPESVNYIERQAFWFCSSLMSITIPESVVSIGSHAFAGCSGLTSITIPESVSILGFCAFQNCNGLTSVSLPNTLMRIEDKAWTGCKGIRDVYCKGDEPRGASDNIFSESVYENATLHVPDNCIDIYMATCPWSLFFNIIEGYNDEGNGDELGGIEQIEANDQDVINYSEPYDLYNIYGCFVGQSIDGLTPGIYIIRQGHTTKKITIQ